MRKTLLSLIVVLSPLYGFPQKETKTLVKINDRSISVADFKRIHEKNLSAIDSEEAKDVEKNLTLFINFKLKVKQAYELKLDTLKSYKKEIETHRNKLIAPYLQDKAYLNSLVEQAYERTKNEIRVSHILVRLPKNYTEQDSLDAYTKILKARDRIVAGESFEVVAKEISEDPSAKENGGDLGFFSAFKMLYEFEDAAYKTALGAVSKPFKTRYGYHFLKKTGSRPSLGERQVAHILIADLTTKGKATIDLIYDKLESGIDFKELASEYSDDQNSKNKGGQLPRFGIGRMVKPFEEAVYQIEMINQYSMPFKTRYGWHVVKLLQKYPIRSFEVMQSEIEERVRRTGRVKLSNNALLDKLKKTYFIEVHQPAKRIFEGKNIENLPEDSLQNVLLTINEKKIAQTDFKSYLMGRRNLSTDVLLKNFIDDQMIIYYKENLEKTNSDFANILTEYQEGLLLFELMQQKIWNQSKDPVALKEYFESNKDNYIDESFEDIKGRVMNDYQIFLDQKWIASLWAVNKIKIRKRMLNYLIQYYKKEH